MTEQDWQVVSNKKTKQNKISTEQNISTPPKTYGLSSKLVIQTNTSNEFDPIIARQREAQAKLDAEKQASKQIKYGEQKDPTANWDYTTLSKTKSKNKTKVSQLQREASAIKENADGDIKIKKVSKSMAKAIMDARLAKQWTQVQLAHNSAVDTKTIGEIERSGCVYNANIFNKLCKTLGVNVERNFDLI